MSKVAHSFRNFYTSFLWNIFVSFAGRKLTLHHDKLSFKFFQLQPTSYSRQLTTVLLKSVLTVQLGNIAFKMLIRFYMCLLNKYTFYTII